jgi:hypothetical protein
MRLTPNGAQGFPVSRSILSRRSRISTFAGALVERWKRADDSGAACLDHEIGAGCDEHRRGDRWDAQAAFKRCGNRHE